MGDQGYKHPINWVITLLINGDGAHVVELDGVSKSLLFIQCLARTPWFCWAATQRVCCGSSKKTSAHVWWEMFSSAIWRSTRFLRANGFIGICPSTASWSCAIPKPTFLYFLRPLLRLSPPLGGSFEIQMEPTTWRIIPIRKIVTMVMS